MVMHVSLASEVNDLRHMLDRISERDRRHRDFTLNSLTVAIREVIAASRSIAPISTGSDESGSQAGPGGDRAGRQPGETAQSGTDAVDLRLRRRHAVAASIPAATRRHAPSARHSSPRFQQTTGPVMAKGLEDTAFYVYNRLISLNEVGGEPEQFGTLARQPSIATTPNAPSDWPHALLATSTHDTKRSEDVRARIDVLSEIPREWRSGSYALERV